MTPALQPLEGKYEIVAKIKEGGMGAIYKVRHRLLDELRVVKVVRRRFEDDAELNQRFVHEARSAIRLRHPNVVQIFDFLIEEGIGYIVMEYIDGVDLGELIQRRHQPSLTLFLEVARQGLRALGYLHQQGYVHRDVSPDNLMLCCDFAGRPLVKMIDLGIAKKVDGGAGLTTSGMFLGKFRYSSPEHFGSQGVGSVEPRSDLYSFAIVLYEFLTGTYPIRGEVEPQLIAGHLFHPPVEFEESDPDGRVPKALREVLLKTLDKDPARRFASAADFARELRQLQKQFPLNDAALAEAKTISTQRPEEQPVKPGSTQSRLDRGFVHPTPAKAAGSAVPASQNERLRRAQVEALLGGVETLLRLGQTEAARGQLVSILEIDAGNARARELLRGLGATTGIDDDATIAMGGGTPPPARLPDFEERRFDYHLRAACSLVEEGAYADAVSHFEAALEVRPGNEMVLGMLAEARGKLEEQRQATRALIANEVAQLRELVTAGELAKARARLLSARRAYGDAEPLAAVENEIERRKAGLEVHRIAEVAEEAEGLREAGDFTLAARTLERAREALRAASIGDVEEARDLAARLDREEASLERDLRRAAELDEAVYAIETAISERRLMEADRALFQACEDFGPALPRLRQLRERLDELHHRDFEKQVAALVDEAAELAGAGDFDAARGRLAKARVVAPPGSAARARVEEEEVALVAAAARRREEDFDAARREVEELIARHELEQAQARLAAAEGRFGELEPARQELFGRLRERIAEGFQERVNALIHEAGVALEAHRYSAAVSFLEQALELAPGDDWLAARLEQARTAAEQE